MFNDKVIPFTEEARAKLDVAYEKNKHLYQQTFQGVFHSKDDLYEKLLNKDNTIQRLKR